ncbi:Lysophospholipase L1 [Gracilibacillus orientalis]|uniref:Lysophospholipase L1 n=1 Tax=Gracilibacillus orientalis TaxID=334253 RepID=A0A1I4NS79_9BACI|nr:GDSL-type esterase/lipase family protein [Gracilibacillus orientalis]SFM18220.1 Lysophospholipase L1 [Gracilibacillus orientalis]
MSKKVFIFIIFILAAGTAIFLLLSQTDTKETTDSISQPNEEPSEETTTEAETTEEQKGSITENVRNAVREALNFFQKDTHITAIGDSLTQGIGDEAGNGGYIGVLDERLDEQDIDVTFDNFGKRGNRTDHLLKRLQEKPEINESLEKADMVLITIGANDVMQIMKDNFMDLTEEPFMAERGPYGERLSQIMDHIISVQPEAKIYLLGFFNPFEKYFGDIEALNQILTRWNNESLQVTNQYEQVDYIPMQDIYQYETENVFSDDHFHPNHKGYKLMAERVITYLENDLQEVQN